ncbi:MAG: T9SS type A sorting domain-containing protein, partial [Psychroflexus sp.]|nr:T9SS type A sorting domain-containing protein [Psychroflexus sp.]
GPIEQVAIQWNEPTTGPTPTGYEVYLGTDQNSLNFLGTAQSDAAGSPINITGMQYDTTYYWEIVPINGPVSATGTQVWSFTTEDNLSNEQFETVNFDFYVNNGQLFLNANQSFDQISIFDLSGKKVMSQELSSNDENVSIQSLASGLYLAKVQIGEQTKTIKFLK